MHAEVDPDPPLDWSSRAHVYPDEDGKALIRISLEYSHDLLPKLKTNGSRKHLICVHNHPVYSGIWRVKKVHPGGKVITCFMHKEVNTGPNWLNPGIKTGNIGENTPFSPQTVMGEDVTEQQQLMSPARLPPIDTNGAPTAPGANEMDEREHPMDLPFWDVELHPDKTMGVPQNLTMTHRIPLADSGRPARRRKTTVSFAPPLLFHTRMDIHNVWKIDAMSQLFCADVILESRLRSVITGEPDQEAAQSALDELFALYEVDHKALEVKDADFTDYNCWHDLVVAGAQGRWDYTYV